MVTRIPRATNNLPRLDAVSPLPRLEATPPVTKICLVTCAWPMEDKLITTFGLGPASPVARRRVRAHLSTLQDLRAFLLSLQRGMRHLKPEHLRR